VVPPIHDLNASGQVSEAHLAETFERDVQLACLWCPLDFNLECA
jgi:hypothetical protein